MSDEAENEQTAAETPQTGTIRVGIALVLVFGNLHRMVYAVYELPGSWVKTGSRMRPDRR